MSAEVGRKEFGMTDKGAVVVVEKTHFADHGPAVSTFEVRHGVRTVLEGVGKAQAEAVANALVNNLPPPPSSPAAGRVAARPRGY